MALQMAELIIGTRGSPLALAQANETRRLLVTAGIAATEEIAIKTIRTSGDRITDRPLADTRAAVAALVEELAATPKTTPGATP